MPNRALLLLTAAAIGGLAAAPLNASAATEGEQICEVDAADPSPVPWVRLQRVVARVAERCQGGDVMVLFAFSDTGHATDVGQLAPLVCRFDSQILMLDAGDGSKRLVCVYTGKARDTR